MRCEEGGDGVVSVPWCCLGVTSHDNELHVVCCEATRVE